MAIPAGKQRVARTVILRQDPRIYGWPFDRANQFLILYIWEDDLQSTLLRYKGPTDTDWVAVGLGPDGVSLQDSEMATTVGPQGIQGEKGLKGDPGVPGTAGSNGQVGQMGLQGNPGPQGPPGEQGPAGPRGFTGLDGDSGPRGLVGEAGPRGEAGPQGLSGPSGSVGPMGPPGVAGSPGPQGERGFQGDPGAAGPMGPKGNDGATGPAGAGLGTLTATTPSRALDSAFVVHATKNAFVSYPVRILASATVVLGSGGKVQLLSDANNPPTTERGVFEFSVNSGLLVTEGSSGNITALVKAGDYVMLKRTNLTGTPTITVGTAQTETLLG